MSGWDVSAQGAARVSSSLSVSLQICKEVDLAMADAGSTVAFGRAAVQFQVHESDFLVLVQDRITTFEAMAYRFPQSTDFEEFLKRVVRTTAGYRDSGGVAMTFPREHPGGIQTPGRHWLSAKVVGFGLADCQEAIGEACWWRRWS